MKVINYFSFVTVILLSITAHGQKDAPQTVYVAKDCTIKVSPADAELYINDEKDNSGDTRGIFEKHFDKGETFNVEVRKKGFQSVKRICVRQKGGASECPIDLTTRVVQVTAVPSDAQIFANGNLIGTDMQDATIPKGQTVLVEVKKPGYRTVSKTYYNRDGAEDPELSHMFQLEDRVVAVKAIPDDASILLDGSKIGEGHAEVVIKKDACASITVEHTGFQSEKKYLCNNGVDDLPVSVNAELKTRVVKINTAPSDAKIFVNNVNMGNGAQDIVIPKGESVLVEARLAGYLPVSKTFYNKEGEEKPDASYVLRLDDRIISLKSSPADASISVDGVKKGVGAIDIVVKKGACVNVTVDQNGYAPETRTFCNKENDLIPQLSEEIKLTDRVSRINVQPEDASIIVDGKLVGTGSTELKIPDGRCFDVEINKAGYAVRAFQVCNSRDKNPPENAYSIKMVDDEAYTQTDESGDIANHNHVIEVNTQLTSKQAWQKLISIISQYFDELKYQDEGTIYLCTDWKPSQALNLHAEGSVTRIIRTQVVVTNAGTGDKLKYNVKIKSEISKTSRSCCSGEQKYPSPNQDECYEPFPRILRTYNDLINQLQRSLQ